MKKMWLRALAIAAAVAIAPFAKADSFAFDFGSQSGDFVAQGTLTATEIGTTGVWNITSVTGAFTDTGNGLNIIGQAIHLYPDGTTPQAIDSV